jgi:hypothetical protein
MISLPVFRRLLDLFGANLARWPESTRQPARRLRAESTEAERHWRDAQHLDRCLHDFDPQFGPSALARVRAAVLQATRDPAPRPFIWRMLFQPLMAEAALFTTVAVVGLTIGLFVTGNPFGGPTDADVIQLISSIE